MGSLSAFDVRQRARGVRGPHPSALPAAAWIVDATVEPLGMEPKRIRNAHHRELAVNQSKERPRTVARRNRNVVAGAQRAELVDPRVVARVRATRDLGAL